MRYVRLNGWVTKTQKAFLEKEAKNREMSETELVREALFKVYKIK